MNARLFPALIATALVVTVSSACAEAFTPHRNGNWIVMQGGGNDSIVCAMTYGGREMGFNVNRTDALRPRDVEIGVLSKIVRFNSGQTYAFNLIIDAPSFKPVIFSGLLEGIESVGSFYRAVVMLNRTDFIDGIVRASVEGGKLTVAFPGAEAGPLVVPLEGAALRAIHWLDDCASATH